MFFFSVTIFMLSGLYRAFSRLCLSVLTNPTALAHPPRGVLRKEPRNTWTERPELQPSEQVYQLCREVEAPNQRTILE